jgi:hypothetical protein
MLKVILCIVLAFTVSVIVAQPALSTEACIGMWSCTSGSSIFVDFLQGRCTQLQLADVVPGQSGPHIAGTPNSVLVWQRTFDTYYDVRCTLPSGDPCECVQDYVFSYALSADARCYNPITDRLDDGLGGTVAGNLYIRRNNDGEPGVLCGTSDLFCFYTDAIDSTGLAGTNSDVWVNDFSPAVHVENFGEPLEYCECHTASDDAVDPCNVDADTIAVNPFNTDEAPQHVGKRLVSQVQGLISSVDASGVKLPEHVSKALDTFRGY